MRFASSEDFLRTVVLVLEILVLSYSTHSLYYCGLLHRQSLLVVGRACISESNRPCLLFDAFDESKNLYSFYSIIDYTFLSSFIYQMNTRSSILRLKYLHLQASPPAAVQPFHPSPTIPPILQQPNTPHLSIPIPHSLLILASGSPSQPRLPFPFPIRLASASHLTTNTLPPAI